MEMSNFLSHGNVYQLGQIEMDNSGKLGREMAYDVHAQIRKGDVLHHVMIDEYSASTNAHSCADNVPSVIFGGDEPTAKQDSVRDTNMYGVSLCMKQEQDDDTINVDRYGFSVRKSKNECDANFHQGEKFLSISTATHGRVKEAQRVKKWIKMMKRWDFTIKFRGKKLKRRIRKGVPDAIRGKVWIDLMYSEALKWRKSHPTQFLKVNEVDGKILEDIEKDVDRTYPNHILFACKDSLGQKSLRNVLSWYAALDPEIGYCQGMGFVAAMLLTYMTEEDAFYTLVAVLHRPVAPFRKMYSPDMFATQRFLDVFGDLGRMYLPNIFSKFDQEGMHQSMFLTEWIMTIFTRNFSFEFVTRVWDIFLYEDFKILYRICLGLLKSIETKILKADFESIMHTIRRIPQEVDIEEALKMCWSIPLERKKINELNDAYDRRRGASV